MRERTTIRLLPAMLMLAAGLPAQAERAPEKFQLAVGLQQRGLHQEAADYLRAFLREDPAHALAAEARYRLAQSAFELQRPDEAATALEAALDRGGAKFHLRPEALYRLGGLRQQAGRPDAAAAQFERLLAEVPATHYLAASAAYALGECRQALGDDAAAEAAFEKAVTASRGDRTTLRFPALYQLGFAQLRQQRHAAAAESFAAAAEVAEQPAARNECLFLRGDALLRAGDASRAESAFGAVDANSEHGDDALFGQGWAALARGDRKAARDRFRRVATLQPPSPFAAQAWLECGRAAYQDGDFRDAAAALDQVVAAGGEHVLAAQELRGLTALALGDGEAAIGWLQPAREAAAGDDRARLSFALGEALVAVLRLEDALVAFGEVPADAPPELRGDALYGRCHVLHLLGRYDESKVAAQQLLALEPAHRAADLALLAVAENAFAARDYGAAEGAYARLLDRPAHAHAAAFKQAWCSYLLGRHDAAAERFEAVAKGDPKLHFEESLAMAALARLEAGHGDAALEAADRYAVRFPSGAFRDRTERVAARVLRQRGDLVGAEKRLAAAQAAASQREGDAAAADAAELAELAYQRGDYRAAAERFAPLVPRADTIGARAAAGLAWCAFELGDDEACERALAAAQAHAAAAAERPGLLELAVGLASRRAQWDAAVAAGKQFVAEFSAHARAPQMRWALAVAQARHGDPAAARSGFESLRAHGMTAFGDRLDYELAWACRRSGDDAAALAHFGRLAEAGDDEELVGEARWHLGDALLAKSPPDLAAARELLTAVRGSHRSRALYRLAFAELEAAGDDKAGLARARDHFLAIAAVDGDALRHEALFCAADVCRRLGDHRGVLERGRQLLEEAPEHARAARARLLVGDAGVAVGDGAAAIRALEPLVAEGAEASPETARVHLLLGRARLLRREYDVAERHLRRATELSDGTLGAEAQVRIGEARTQRGDLNGAADAFVKVAILYADPQWVRAGLLGAARSYDQLGQSQKAVRFYQELVDRHAGSDEARIAQTRLEDR
jgi:tetratricopeptide (TPR) repeat protein